MTDAPRGPLTGERGGSADLVVLGAGVAGLTVAVEAAERGLRVVVLTKAQLEQSATRYAQGGVAAAVADDDSPELHLRDTLAAGGTLCDPDAVRALTEEGPARLRDLVARGAVFDGQRGGLSSSLALALEGGHSLARVVHAGGDATGAEIGRALLAAAQRAGVELREGWFAVDFVVRDGRCAGVSAVSPGGQAEVVRAPDVVLASGGIGQLFAVTTNPAVATGDGIAMALRAGAAVADLEFVQFHPTALHGDLMPRPLLSEALRGEGAVLRDDGGRAFMADLHHLADLAPRDVVARGIAQRMAAHGQTHVWLDATSIRDFPTRFPTVWRSCSAAGLDPRADWLPVAPAAHYLCGGVLTDVRGATSVPGLWACGEVACTGVNGANRLASNSLLEGLVFGHRVVAALSGELPEPAHSGTLARLSGGRDEAPFAPAPPLVLGGQRVVRGAGDALASAARLDLERAMSEQAGVIRDGVGLRAVAAALDRAQEAAAGLTESIERLELCNLVTVGRALLAAAERREESRGCHTRADFPSTSPALEGRFVVMGGAMRFVPVAAPAYSASGGEARG